MGDPSLSLASTVEQFRSTYIFLAPDDYSENYVVAVVPLGATLTLDGTAVLDQPTPIGSTGFGTIRLALGSGNAGAHAIQGTQPFGIQVIGYGSYTSYQYPGGLDLRIIAPPPT
jgi:hypothetical protein